MNFAPVTTQADLLSLQDYMLQKWGEALWLKAQDEIFEKMMAIDAVRFKGVPVKDLASIGISDYKNAQSSHHRIVYKQVNADTYIYLVANQKQDFQSLLTQRLFSR